MSHLITKDFKKSEAVERIYNPDLMKGEHKTHKYIKKVDGKYTYHEKLQKGKGEKSHHHKMMEEHHSGEMRNAHEQYSRQLSKLSQADHPTEDSIQLLKKQGDTAIEHAKKAGEHKVKKINNLANLNADEYKNYNEISDEHIGIDSNTYANAYHEHENKKQQEKDDNDITEIINSKEYKDIYSKYLADVKKPNMKEREDAHRYSLQVARSKKIKT